MRELGNVLAVAGVLVTFVGYFGQHGLGRFRELEPGLVRTWQRSRAWVLRKLGRTRSVNISVNPAEEISIAESITVFKWSQVQPNDDHEVRLGKLERNLDELRAHIEKMRERDVDRFREVTDRLSDRVMGLAAELARWRTEDQQEATWAMRWEVRGLLLTLLGTGLAVVFG